MLSDGIKAVNGQRGPGERLELSVTASNGNEQEMVFDGISL